MIFLFSEANGLSKMKKAISKREILGFCTWDDYDADGNAGPSSV